MLSMGKQSLLTSIFLLPFLLELILGASQHRTFPFPVKKLQTISERGRFGGRIQEGLRAFSPVQDLASHLLDKKKGKELQVSVRDFTAARLPGTYRGIGEGTCPKELTFADAPVKSFVKGGASPAVAYPVSAITYNGESCTGGNISLIKSTDFIFDPQNQQHLIMIAEQTVFLAIENNDDVQCGSFTYGKGLSFGFFEKKPIQFSPGLVSPADPKIIAYEDANCSTHIMIESKGATKTGNDPKCFTADCQVEFESGEKVRMDNLSIGDRIRVGPNDFSEVFLFTHRDPDYQGEFVKITTKDGHALTLTSGHYLYKNGELAPARSVNVGDYLSRESEASKEVSRVEHVQGNGLYNPQTLHGDIVVNGITVSTFTEAIRPNLARILLKPFGALYQMGFINEERASRFF